MTVFWIVAGGMAAAVAGLLALALLRSRREEQSAADVDMQVYRDQLAEIDRDTARGTIPEEEADRLRTEVSRRLLAADAKARGAGRAATRDAPGTRVVAVLVLLAVIGGGIGIYAQIGDPGYPDLPLQGRIAAAEEARENRPAQKQAEADLPPAPPADVSPDYAELVERLRQTVTERPDDLQGQRLLARTEAALGNYVAAYEAQERIVALRGEQATAKDYADLADMMVLAAGGYVSPEAQNALDAALTRDPRNGVARYYGGLMMAQTGRPDIAFRMWDRLLRESPADAPWVAPIRQQIADMAFRAGVNDYTLPEAPAPDPAAPGPSQEDLDAADEMSPEARMQMIRGMVSGLSERLATEGGTPQEWARLINALGVLGEREQARAIWAEAQGTFAELPEALATVNAAARQAGLTE